MTILRLATLLLPALTAVPTAGGAPPLPPHPRLMLADADVSAVKARIEKAPAVAARYRAIVRSADAWLGKPVELPPRGGQWYHWYACKKDGGGLRAVSPTEHRCNVCGTVYSGWPYDDVVLSGQHSALAEAVRDLGLAHRLSGEPKYVSKAREILLAYAERYTKYPLHDTRGEPKVGGGRVGPQSLDEAVWLIPICQGADLVWDRLSDTDRQTIETGLLRPAAGTIRAHKRGIHNIQCWKNSAVGLVGLLLGDGELVADAVESDHGFKRQVAEGINGDGQWFEGAWGYHFYTLRAMAPLLEAGERCGLGLYDYTADGKGVRRLFEGPLDLAMPDLTLPPFNDSGRVSLAREAPVYELALAHYEDPRFAAAIGAGRRSTTEALLRGVFPLPTPPARTRGSRDFPSAGYAVLQPEPRAGAAWLCLKYGPHGGGHGHPDKLNFILFARGRMLGFDPGTGRYGVPLHAGWQKTTIAHNTLTIDEANQAPATGRALAFLERPGAAAVLAEAGPIHQGVVYRRAAAVFGADLVLVLDVARADRVRTFDLAYHNAGAWTSPPQGRAVDLPDRPGYRHLADMVQSDGPLPAIADGPATVRLGLAAGGHPLVWAGTGAGGSTAVRVPCVVVRSRGEHALVGWAITLDGAAPAVQVTSKGSAATVEATVGGRTYRLTADPDGPRKLAAEVH